MSRRSLPSRFAVVAAPDLVSPEYRDVVGLFKYVIETERRFYLTNEYVLDVRNAGGEVFFEVNMSDAWVWDIYRPAGFVKNVKVVTFKDVNVEELAKSDLQVPDA
jgi:hypothetical protein